MGLVSDESLHSALVTAAMIALFGGSIALLVAYLARSRPGFSIAWPTCVAFAIRVVAAGLVSLTPVAQTLRGGDEVGFLAKADLIALTDPGSGQWTHALLRELHVFNLALQRYSLDSPELALRVTQVSIAVIGLVLLATAVYELGGPRASRLAMWLLALEPAGIFFSGLLHKEANMILATGLVALGGAMVWKRGEPRFLIAVVCGCLIAVATRHYAGWFLIAAGAAILLHAGLRSEHRAGVRSLGLVSLVVLFAAIAAPTVLKASTNESLQENLQPSQNANASDSSNLSLERVDFSTRGAVIRNLPGRSVDVLLRPFPWQLGNISQGLGLLGTASAYLALVFLVSLAYRSRRQLMARAGPLVYLALFLLVAYSLSAGNAGTGFRYRTQIVAVFICIIALLYVSSRQRGGKGETALAGLPSMPSPAPVKPPSSLRYGRPGMPTPTANGAREAVPSGAREAVPFQDRRSQRVRVFRADTPHDVASACLVAAISPGRDYLAISADKAAAERDEYLLTMRAMANAHQWLDIFDVGDLPIGDHGWFNPDARSSRFTLYRDMHRSLGRLEAAVGDRLDPEAVDELFVTSLDHVDIQLMTQALPGAAVSCFPHGLGGLRESENAIGVRLTARPSAARRVRHALAGMLKRPVWGRGATPPLSFEVAACYSFDRPPAFGRERHDLTSMMTPDVMRRLFSALPAEVRQVYESAGHSSAGSAVGLLLLAPSEDRGRAYPHEREARGLAYLAAEIVARHDLERIVIKPHPRNGEGKVSLVADAIRRDLPQTELVVLEEHGRIPMEIGASGMDIAAAAGIGSTAVQTLARIYRMPTYSSDRLLRELNAHDSNWAKRWEDWIRANRDFYISV